MTDEEYLQFLAQEDADLGEVNPYGFFPQDFRYPRNTLTQNIPIATAQNPAMVNYNGIMGTDQANMFYDRGELDELTEAMPEEDNQEKGGIARLFELYQKFSPVNFLKELLPEQDPRAIGIRNFYRPYEGLTSSGSIASGIMKGYNPVSGGLFGTPVNYGLAGAMQRRIENILGRRAAQTDASRARVAELRNLQRAEMEDRFDRGESLSSIGKSTFSGPGMAFEKRQGTTTGKGTPQERNYGGR